MIIMSEAHWRASPSANSRRVAQEEQKHGKWPAQRTIALYSWDDGRGSRGSPPKYDQQDKGCDFSCASSPVILRALTEDPFGSQLEDAQHLAAQDLKYASSTIQADLDRFQRQKVADLREMCIGMARIHLDWCKAVGSVSYTFGSRLTRNCRILKPGRLPKQR